MFGHLGSDLVLLALVSISIAAEVLRYHTAAAQT